MEPKFQSSFIPKKPVVDSPKMLGPVQKNRNIFSVLATFIFMITILASGAEFGYGKYIERQISAADSQLVQVRSAFESDRIQDLIEASARLESMKALLEKHYVVSEILVMLQNMTLKAMQFDSLSYKITSNTPEINMQSYASSYNAVANQKDVFDQSGVLNNVTFSDFSLDDRGVVSSKFYANVSPKLVSYKEMLESGSRVSSEQ